MGIFEEVRNLNKPIQDPQINNLTQNDKFNTFTKVFELWRTKQSNVFDMFYTSERCRPSKEREANKKLFINHLDAFH